MIVVSDSSPLITLSRAQNLDLLREFYGQVVIPDTVYEEVTVAGAGLPGAEEVRQATWIQKHPNPSEPGSEMMTACADLGAGERKPDLPGVIAGRRPDLDRRKEGAPCSKGS